MADEWAVLQVLKHEDGKGQVAEMFVLAHGLKDQTAAEEMICEEGADGVTYIVLPLRPGRILLRRDNAVTLVAGSLIAE